MVSDKKFSIAGCLAKAEYFENHGDYVNAIQVIYEGLLEDPHNPILKKKREDLQAIISWNC